MEYLLMGFLGGILAIVIADGLSRLTDVVKRIRRVKKMAVNRRDPDAPNFVNATEVDFESAMVCTQCGGLVPVDRMAIHNHWHNFIELTGQTVSKSQPHYPGFHNPRNEID